MCGEYFLLLFQNVADFFLESKELLIFLVSHGPFHRIQVILYLSLFLHFCFLFNLYFFVNNVLLIRLFFLWNLVVSFTQRWVTVVRSRTASYYRLLIGIWPVFLFLLGAFLFLSTDLIVYQRKNRFWLLRWVRSLWRLIGCIRFGQVFRHLRLILRLYRAFVSVIVLFGWLLLFEILIRIVLLHVLLWRLFLGFNTFIHLILLYNLVAFFTQLCLVFESVCVS